MDNIYLDPEEPLDFPFTFDRDLLLALNFDFNLYKKLQQLINHLPNLKNKEGFAQWWRANGEVWTADLRAIMIKYCNIGHDWQFSYEQTELLENYYFANQLLTQCLHRECYLSREVRQEIEETLLLPISEIEKRKSMGTI
ncbi:MAG: hypothetical protein QNJ34_24350 [Xenococcaceae cyanobacterium MO_188.B29]|nr:hypothetical protein [Xenococcaceae cyanobacterium MO_188.B29]